ncbi:MAG TPA: helix-turn-helix domain-containing protein [Gemmataceae bacterium]|nr:helix-turn-helix domain-containing protein [Gemmataceae bacterium]
MKTRTQKATDRYLELVQCVPLRPIRDDDELDEAINMVNYLIDRERLTVDEQDYLDVLSDLIEKYESEHVVFERVCESDMLRFLIEAKGVTQAKVAKDCRIAESTISEILAGERKMNRNHIAKLAAYFNVGPGVFFTD